MCTLLVKSTNCAQLNSYIAGQFSLCKNGNCSSAGDTKNIMSAQLDNTGNCLGIINSITFTYTLVSANTEYTLSDVSLVIKMKNEHVSSNSALLVTVTITGGVGKPAAAGSPGYQNANSLNINLL